MSFPFEKLPAELRNEIYQLVLNADEHVPTTSIYALSPQGDGPAILRLNRLTHKEAAPIYYSAKRFFFNTPSALEQFIRDSKTVVPHIRYVRLSDYTEAGLARALPKLGKAVNLKVLEIPLRQHQGRADKEADVLTKGIRGFVKIASGVSARRRQYDMLRFTPGNGDYARMKEATAKVKAEVERRLVSDGTLERTDA